jgi:8-oxo-dGTP diphosphatase
VSADGASRAALLVVAALIEGDTGLLICQRSRRDPFPLKWEFPGGKVNPGESMQAALARELEEELGVKARIGAEVYRTRHRYGEMDRDVELAFLAASVNPAEIRNLAFEQMTWTTRARLADYDFLEADRALVEKLQNGLPVPRVR